MLTCPFDKIHPSALTRDDPYFMAHAFNLAIDAWNADEVPVGAVIVRNGEIILRLITKQGHKQILPHMLK